MEFDFSPIADNWRFFASGLSVTIALSIVSAITSILAGLFIALLRLYGPSWLRPLLVFYIDTMRANLAAALEVDIDQVSVKAKTGEGLDAVGERRAVSAQAIVLLTQK